MDDEKQQQHVRLEPKYDVDLATGRVLNRASGQLIPEDEPLMLFRGQDAFVPDMIAAYFRSLPKETAADLEHRAAVAKNLARITEWQAENSLRVKKPDTILDEGWDR